MARVYDSSAWEDLRAAALERDEGRCTLGRLFGGDCTNVLDVHHLIPVSEGGPELPPLHDVLTACSSHHPMLEAMRRYVMTARERGYKRCTRHRHPYRIGREECERRLNGLPPRNIAA